MGIPPLWEHLLKAYEHVNLPHRQTFTTLPPHLHKLDCGYTKLTPQHTHRLYKLHMSCKTCHCQAMQDHIAITSKPSTYEELYTCAKRKDCQRETTSILHTSYKCPQAVICVCFVFFYTSTFLNLYIRMTYTHFVILMNEAKQAWRGNLHAKVFLKTLTCQYLRNLANTGLVMHKYPTSWKDWVLQTQGRQTTKIL